MKLRAENGGQKMKRENRDAFLVSLSHFSPFIFCQLIAESAAIAERRSSRGVGMLTFVRSFIAVAAVLVFVAIVAAQTTPSPLEKNKSLKELMPRIPHTAAEDAIKTMRVELGFKLELVAAEPDVGDPVDACFDEQG
ncbi:MAG TPA: hypothetical protein VK137_07120, partial [Planctomycetaceae bacterium]|nr:hypothetical protein [Planctomycetaceae bacterium]